MNRLSLAAVALAVPVAVIACGSKDQTPAQTPTAASMQAGYPQGYPQQGYPQQGYPTQPGAYPTATQPGAYPTAPAGYPTAPAGYPTTPGAPGTAPAGTATAPFGIPGLPTQPAGGGASGGSAQALDPNLAGLAVMPLNMYATTEAPGMAKEGNTIAGNFGAAGQTLEGAFTFQPGKCYTVVAQGAGPTIELEMDYTTPIPGLNPQIAKSAAGTQVSIGGKANCLRPVSPFPAQAKFVLRATAGAGVAAAQLYSK